MDAAGEAASTSGSRFVIFIDALNDTQPPDFWRVRLPSLRAAIEQYPHVALVVSCRDTYQEPPQSPTRLGDAALIRA
jgi:hypothetical protein